MKHAIGIAAVLLAATTALWFNWPCHTLACARHHNPWFMLRYDPRIPIYLTSDNVGTLLSEIPDKAQRRAAVSLFRGVTSDIARSPAENAGATLPVSCAVVGNSGNLINSGYGMFIDTHDAIFRMNNAPVEAFTRDVGSRTTHSVGYALTGNAYGPEALTLRYIAKRPRGLDEEAYSTDYRKMAVIEIRELVDTLPPPLDRIRGFRIIHPDFIEYVGKSWFEPDRKIAVNYPSTGLYTIILALHMCDNVDLFGFGPDKDGRWTHYYDQQELGWFHRPDFQEAFIAMLTHHGITRIFRGNAEPAARPR